MKSALLANVLVLTTTLAIALTPGCRRKPKHPTPLPSRTGSTIVNPSPGLDSSGAFDPGGPLEGQDIATHDRPATGDGSIPLGGAPLPRDQFQEDRQVFAGNVVYFDFDSAVVRSSEMSKITAVAEYLRSTPGVAVEVEGHCDERGTEEYNRSLGERRALGIREELALQGIDPSRVYTISYGEDRPAVDGQDEYAYSQNRRGEFVLLRPR